MDSGLLHQSWFIAHTTSRDSYADRLIVVEAAKYCNHKIATGNRRSAQFSASGTHPPRERDISEPIKRLLCYSTAHGLTSKKAPYDPAQYLSGFNFAAGFCERTAEATLKK